MVTIGQKKLLVVYSIYGQVGWCFIAGKFAGDRLRLKKNLIGDVFEIQNTAK